MNDPFVVIIDSEAEWHHSRFPHPLVTVDYDRHDRPYQVVAVGPVAERWTKIVLEAVAA